MIYNESVATVAMSTSTLGLVVLTRACLLVTLPSACPPPGPRAALLPRGW